MYSYSIMPLMLDDKHLDAICEDIKEQYEKGICNCALMMIKLVPEGDPLISKAEIQCQKYERYAKKLNSMGIECGVHVQCTIGHGYALDSMPNLTRVKNLSDGNEPYVFCPLDQRFREYIRHSFEVIASYKPKHIMVEDDFRLIYRDSKGCVCEHHMAALQKKIGTVKTREEILKACTENKAEDKPLRDAFIETQLESLIDCAKYMREGIDRVDPTIPASFCGAGTSSEAAGIIASILAGKGNPVQVRVHNGRYCNQGVTEFSDNFMRVAVQIVTTKNQCHVDKYIAETDTCPQNRYSTGAMSLHTHFTGSILEGVSGAKHWITRIYNYEPDSGKKYREVLSKYSKFYETLSQLVPTLKWRGARIPISTTPEYCFVRWGDSTVSGFGTRVLERMGIPFYFSEMDSKVAFLDSNMDVLFSDGEIEEMLKSTLILDGPCAQSLCNRGFGHLLGVEVSPWQGENVSGEICINEDTQTIRQIEAREIKILDDKVITDSYCYHLKDGVEKVPLFPAVTIYKNALGGTAIVFGGKVKTDFHYATAFSFLNETRKKQLVRLLKSYGDIPIYVPNDDQVYLRVADMEDGSKFVAYFNVSLDPVENIILNVDFKPQSIEFLDPNGEFKVCNFTYQKGKIILDLRGDILTPQILKIK